MKERVLADQAQLQIIGQNVEAALAMEPEIAAAAAAARDLLSMVESPGFVGGAYHIGFRLPELGQLQSNLAWYAAVLDRKVLSPLRYLQRRVQEALDADERTLAQIAAAETSEAPLP
jgi:hypothetical protein